MFCIIKCPSIYYSFSALLASFVTLYTRIEQILVSCGSMPLLSISSYSFSSSAGSAHQAIPHPAEISRGTGLFTDCFQLHGICRCVKCNDKLVDSFPQFYSLNYKSITCSSSNDTRYLSVTSFPASWESALAYHSIWLRYRAVSSSAALTRSVL